MKKLNNNWMFLLSEIEIYKPGKEFLEKFNSDLQKEFEVITGFPFSGKDFFLVISGYGNIEYVENIETPFARLQARLLFYGDDGMPVTITWFDRKTRQIYKPGEDVTGSEIEFHWEDFDIHHPALRELEMKSIDIRKKYKIKVKFPVVARVLTFNNDFEVRIMPFKIDDADEVVTIFKTFQNEWNEMSAQTSNPKIIHSWSYEGVEDDSILVFSIDIGSSDFDCLISLFQNINQSSVRVKQIELINP